MWQDSRPCSVSLTQAISTAFVPVVIDEPTVESAIEVCQWYVKEFGRIFNPDMAIEEAATHVLTKLKERVASKNGGQIPEIATR
ncbi:hypothetical protein [Paraburkholderia fungorum]